MPTEVSLIIEDQFITALDLKCILKKCGYINSVILDKGKKALDFIESDTPFIALLDINLADNISGIEVAKKLKEKEIPFIFISAFSNPENYKKAADLNPLAIIKKPIDEKNLHEVLHNYKISWDKQALI